MRVNDIKELIETLEFGEIVIKVQNGKVVLIEKTEKIKPEK